MMLSAHTAFAKEEKPNNSIVCHIYRCVVTFIQKKWSIFFILCMPIPSLNNCRQDTDVFFIETEIIWCDTIYTYYLIEFFSLSENVRLRLKQFCFFVDSTYRPTNKKFSVDMKILPNNNRYI